MELKFCCDKLAEIMRGRMPEVTIYHQRPANFLCLIDHRDDEMNHSCPYCLKQIKVLRPDGSEIKPKF